MRRRNVPTIWKNLIILAHFFQPSIAKKSFRNQTFFRQKLFERAYQCFCSKRTRIFADFEFFSFVHLELRLTHFDKLVSIILTYFYAQNHEPLMKFLRNLMEDFFVPRYGTTLFIFIDLTIEKVCVYCLCSENPGLKSPGMNEHVVNNE